jgi:hypothetical protein
MMTSSQIHRDVTRCAQRPGVVLVAVIVTLTIGLALFAVWAQTIVRERRQMANQQLRLQAVRLAEAGIQRALARRAADPDYGAETWSVPATHLGGKHAAAVRIRLTPAENTAMTRVEATAEYPVGALRRAQFSTRIEVANSSRDES